MNDTNQVQPAATPKPAGVPLGGVGAGSIELGRDGRFRNITINNNRTDDKRILISEGAFLAVRAQQRGKVFARILQDQTGLPFEEAGIIPQCTPADQLSWRGLYPRSSYKLADEKFPVQVRWSYMAPIIPYDLAASTMPLVLATLHLKNTTDAPLEVATLFNWENLCGCVRDYLPARRGPIRPVLLKEDTRETTKEEDEESELPPRMAGLEFGFRRSYRTNADGHYCLLAKQQEDVDITVMTWDEANPMELRALWELFHDQGRLVNRSSRSKTSHAGAVCCSFNLLAGQSRSVVYIFSWYCPQFEVNGVDLGNYYTNQFDDAIEVAAHALKYYRYYFDSVKDWQERFLSSSLPRWFSKMLLNSNYVFSTNSIFTRDGEFAMMESPSQPAMGVIDRRFNSSIGTLLFFPDLEERELSQFAKAEDPETPGRIYRQLGKLCIHEPSHGEGPSELMDVNAKFVLMAYRNYVMTGRVLPLQNLYPKLIKAMEYTLSKDVDDDGLPEQSGLSTTFDTWALYGVNSYNAGLWIAAVRAFVKLARVLDQRQHAQKYEQVFAKAIRNFDRRLWNETEGYYNLYHDPKASGDRESTHEGCHCGQLAGQWYAHFLSMGHLFLPERIKRALDSMRRINEQDKGVANGLMPDGSPWPNPASVLQDPQTQHSWPASYIAHYSCLQIYQGGVDRGLRSIQKAYKNIHVTRARAFNQPLVWDLARNNARDHAMDRHMGSPSVWHVLYALQGFLLNIPDQTLWVRPNLPLKVHSLSAPLVTPACLGWLKFIEEDQDVYRQQVRVSFDGPTIHVKRIVLRIPEQVGQVHVHCVSQEGVEETEHTYGHDGEQRLIEITCKKPILVGSGLTITLQARRTSTPAGQPEPIAAPKTNNA